MILFRYYDEEKKLDRLWYDSSNVFYSECEDGDSAKKVLRVVFKNGATYQYSDVDVNDYVMFIYLKWELYYSSYKLLMQETPLC